MVINHSTKLCKSQIITLTVRHCKVWTTRIYKIQAKVSPFGTTNLLLALVHQRKWAWQVKHFATLSPTTSTILLLPRVLPTDYDYYDLMILTYIKFKHAQLTTNWDLVILSSDKITCFTPYIYVLRAITNYYIDTFIPNSQYWFQTWSTNL